MDEKGIKNSFQVHKGQVYVLFVVTVAVCITVYFSVSMHHSNGATIVATVISAGILGSFVSALRRLYASKGMVLEIYIEQIGKNKLYLVAYSLIPPVIGAISAIFLYLVFAAGLLQGSMFPVFSCDSATCKCNEFSTFVTGWSPKAAEDYAKAIVYGFLAGFSERFVPHVIEKISGQNGV